VTTHLWVNSLSLGISNFPDSSWKHKDFLWTRGGNLINHACDAIADVMTDLFASDNDRDN